METHAYPKQKGQVLVLVAILMVVLLALLALVLDGGNLLLNRRSAQNAADAAALAGARTYCLEKSAARARTVAEDYAINRNGAGSADITIGTTRDVTVTAHITYTTFFAHLLGFDELTAEATAAAGCFAPTGGERVMPIAWICKPPMYGPNPSSDCAMQPVTETVVNNYLANPSAYAGTIHPDLYIVMDSASTPDDLKDICDLTINCDLDGDGYYDLIANGDRSWLDLDGSGGGASSLISWVNGGFTDIININTWIGGQSGVANSIFQAVGDHIGDIFALPIFDAICDGWPATDCPIDYVSTDTIIRTAGGNYYYRIVGFAAFVPTCVDAPGVGVPGGCPGHNYAVLKAGIPNNTKTIEGFFITGILSELSGGSTGSTAIDMGAYNLRLYR